MKERTTKVYNCEYCNKESTHKNVISRHEKRCNLNPINFDACLGCNFCVKKQKVIISEFYENEITVDAFFCENPNVDSELYPHKAVTKGITKRYPESFKESILMPNNCKHFKAEEFKDYFPI